MDFPMIPTPINPIFFISFFPFPLICRYFYDTSVFIHIGLSVLPVLIFFYDFAFVFINTVCRNKSSYRRQWVNIAVTSYNRSGVQELPHPTSTSSPSIAPNFFMPVSIFPSDVFTTTSFLSDFTFDVIEPAPI